MMRAVGGARRRSGFGTGLLVGAAMCAGAAVAIGTRFAEQVLTPAPRPERRVRVEDIEPAEGSPAGLRVWLSGPDTELEGSYSFIFDAESRLTQHLAGHARLGPVVSVTGTGGRRRVARNVLSIERGELAVGTQGRITGWWFTGPEQLPYESRLVSIPLPDGVGWGWVIAPDRPTTGRWVVHVHGRGALPQETLRGVEVFAEAGFTSLVIAYRNDAGAPRGTGGRYGLGLAEQADVDAAIGWAVSQGADRVALVGWSMGATAAVLAAGLGRHASAVEAMVLDSPALDWRRLLRHQARLARLPGLIAEVGMLLLRTGWVRGAIPGDRGTDLSALTSERLAGLIRVPTLIHASPDDTYVPWEGALRVAQLRASRVRLHPSRGEHVKLWNVDPEAWNRETASFLAGLDDPRTRDFSINRRETNAAGNEHLGPDE